MPSVWLLGRRISLVEHVVDAGEAKPDLRESLFM